MFEFLRDKVYTIDGNKVRLMSIIFSLIIILASYIIAYLFVYSPVFSELFFDDIGK